MRDVYLVHRYIYLEMFCEGCSVRDIPWYTGMYTMYFNVVVGVVYLEMFCEGCTLVHRYIPRNVL